jgi:hypothetical protein
MRELLLKRRPASSHRLALQIAVGFFAVAISAHIRVQLPLAEKALPEPNATFSAPRLLSLAYAGALSFAAALAAAETTATDHSSYSNSGWRMGVPLLPLFETTISANRRRKPLGY